MKWRDSLSVGYEEFDNDLKTMFKELEKKIQALTATRGHLAEGADVSMNQIIKIFIDNFEKQEMLMSKSDFKNYFQHKFQHDSFLKKIEEMKETLMADEFSAGANVSNINSKIYQWLVLHITTLDKEFGKHYKEYISKEQTESKS